LIYIYIYIHIIYTVLIQLMIAFLEAHNLKGHFFGERERERERKLLDIYMINMVTLSKVLTICKLFIR